MKRLLSILVLMALAIPSFATHNRAGEIIFSRVNDTNPFLYSITIVTYTRYVYPGSSASSDGSNDADRCQLDINFGDGTSAIVNRTNGVGDPNSDCDEPIGSGIQIVNGKDLKKNEYTVIHEFPGPGTYTVSMEDPNRTRGINNIPNSVEVPFYIQSSITVDQFSGGNNAPNLANPPIDDGCVNAVFEHNPGAVDPDGDSLVYSIVSCRGADGVIINDYLLPNQVGAPAGNRLTIDPRTGDLVWNSPKVQGEYNICIQIDEYRRNPNNGNIIRVGSIIRDMQITITTCDQDPPNLFPPGRSCVTAGQVLDRTIVAEDEEATQLSLTATGFPFEADNRATLNGLFQTGNDPLEVTGVPPITADFRWQTACNNIQLQPYWVYFKAKQIGGVELADFETYEIRVVAPAVQITSIVPQGKTFQLQWTQATCTQAVGYDVYRFNDSIGYVAAECVTGVPDDRGYVMIGSTDGLGATSFVDDNDGLGLVHGQRYCYMIVTRYPDGSESYPSEESCAELIRDVPILNKVSVIETDSVNGGDSISWYKPIDLKTDIFGPPYRYQLSRSSELNGTFEVIYTGPQANDFLTLDTVYVDSGLNTLREQYFYKIVLLSNGEETGESRRASSVFLSSIPSDNQLRLVWDANVPWTNDRFVIHRFRPNSTVLFDTLDTVQGTSYVDRNLANLREYSYFVTSIGSYSSDDLPEILLNNSQIHTGIPIDLEAPCPPASPFIDGDCEVEENSLSWENPMQVCDSVDDVVSYNIYFADQLGKPLQLIESIDDPATTSFRDLREGSIAGCYAITAIDSFDNESEFSASLCVDNCPEYTLPNVFTPGGDGTNDFFGPFPYKFVESISIQIFNRWGELVFETTDPDINWEGVRQSNGEEMPNGVYYYDCTVNEIRLTGIVPRTIRGYVHLIKDSSPASPAP